MCKWDRAWATKWGESVLLTPHHKWSNVPPPQHRAPNIQTCLLVLLLSPERLISNLSGHVKTVEGCAERLADPCRGQLWLHHLKPEVATVLKPLLSYCLFSPLRLSIFQTVGCDVSAQESILRHKIRLLYFHSLAGRPEGVRRHFFPFFSPKDSRLLSTKLTDDKDL